jgi:hypothetical protein
MSLPAILSGTPVESISDAIEIMSRIDQSLPDNDGVKWFNRLYLRVTENVGAAVTTAQFNDAAFLAKLDVVFANLYFSALADGLIGTEVAPSARRPLLQARNSPGIARLQFALAGMNAHINRDLPEGIVRAFVELGGDVITDTVREVDFNSVNDILERVEQEVKAEFMRGVLGAIDRLGGPVDDAVAMWNVRTARSAAWTNAQVLWGLRRVPPLRDRFFRRLDGLVGLASRGLLLPRRR